LHTASIIPSVMNLQVQFDETAPAVKFVVMAFAEAQAHVTHVEPLRDTLEKTSTGVNTGLKGVHDSAA
jgi:hypothetical protein